MSSYQFCLSHEDRGSHIHEYNENHGTETIRRRLSGDSFSTCSVDTVVNHPFQIISSDVTTADGLECCVYSELSDVDAFVKSGPCEDSASKTIRWTMDEKGKIHSIASNDQCMTRVRNRVILRACEDNKREQIWAYSSFDQNILWRYSTTLIMSTFVDVLPNNGEKIKLINRNGSLGQAWTLQFDENEAEIIIAKTEYTSGESIGGTFVNPEPDFNAWIAIYPASLNPLSLPSGSTMWNWYRDLSSGSFSFNSTSNHGGSSWPLCNGEWQAFLINGDIVPPYESLAYSDKFTVSGGDCYGSCDPATSNTSALTHKIPVDGDDVRRVAFSSCYSPDDQISTSLWDHVRSNFRADIWSWLGDNTYSDGRDMEYKRVKYNEGKENIFYSTSGPIAEPKIAVTGTWDDHDYGANNMGKYYQCRVNSQNEFAFFFDLPESDPRHPSQGDAQRKGVYNSYMFSKPDGGNGIHLIHIDARYYRSPSYSYFGPCEGADSTILGDTQWDWLQDELNQESEVKIIGSGIQILPPTYRGRSIDSYCSYDGEGGTFDIANAAIGEGSDMDSSEYEMWSEYPQERTKLLQLAQKSINDGKAKKIVFISGDQHWGEILAKKMPNDPTYGSSQTLYEVTGSGVDQNWAYTVPNANRIRIRSADYSGNGDFTKECKFPFIYNDVEYNDCTSVGDSMPWCSIETDDLNNHQTGEWGYCVEEVEELVPRNSIIYSDENTCSGNYLHVCSAQANYGGIEVDWEEQKLILSVFTPHESDPIAASVRIDL